ncbi:M23 family metallopeptidase [Nonomuraea sp. NPDC049714]|uniref:M23 family metallopeptidase n=1 Tax=Nonomuraea sp. NPDC049714 TaxID=3364357 RepID=UPI0037B17777
MSAAPGTAAPATWRWPLNGPPRILRRFAPPPEPWLTGHRGVDLAAPVATPVLAAGQGTIGYAGTVAGRGVVTVNHPGGLRTTYLPVAAAVKQGDPVSSGDHLGTVEPGSPHCPESCLHWGLRRSTAYLDPLLLLGQARIRLLPYWHAKPPPMISPTPPNATPTYASSPHIPSDGHTPEKQSARSPLAPARRDEQHTHTPIARLDNFSLRSTAIPMFSAFGIAALLTVLILLILLRRRMRTNKSRHNTAGGRHSTRNDHTPTAETRFHTAGQHRKHRRRRTRRQ